MGSHEKTNLNIQMLLWMACLALLVLQLFGYGTGTIHLAERLGYYVCIPCLFAVTGYLVRCWEKDGTFHENTRRQLFFYAAMFLGTGSLSVLTGNQSSKLANILNIFLLRKIPDYSEIWFTMAGFFACLFFVLPKMADILKKRICIPVSLLLALAVCFIPADQIGYAIVGLFVGAESYRCIPVLACLFFFVLGYQENGEEESKSAIKRNRAALAGACLLLAVFIWKRGALQKAMTFPTRYWEILAEAGIVLIFLYIKQKDISGRGLQMLSRIKQQDILFLAVLFYLLFWLNGRETIRTCLIPAVFIAGLALYILLCIVAKRFKAAFGNSDSSFPVYVKYFCVYTIGFCILFAVAFSTFFASGTSLVWNGDGIAQYFPKAVYFSDLIRETLNNALQGNFSFTTYDFSIGMGDKVYLTMDPVYWLYALFSADQMDIGYTVISVFRFFLAGLSVSAMLFYFRYRMSVVLLCSYIYTFSGYAIYALANHPQFGVGMTMLPLLIIAVEEILKNRKWYLGSLLIGLTLLGNYYFLYVNTFVLFAYFLIRFWGMDRQKRTLKNFGSYLGTFAFAYILGVGMGCLTLVMKLSSYFGSSRSGMEKLEKPLYYMNDWLSGIYMYFLTQSKTPGYWLRLGFAPIVLIAVVLLFAKKGNKDLKRMLVFSAICLLFPVVGYVMSGAGYVSNRWCYAVALAVTVCVAKYMSDARPFTVREMKLICLVAVPYGILALLHTQYSSLDTLKAFALLAITVILCFCYTEKMQMITYKAFYLLMFAVTIAAFYVGGIQQYEDPTEDFFPVDTVMDEAVNSPLRVFADFEDTSFYRVSMNRQPALKNVGMLLGFNGISCYNSTLNSKIQQYHMEMDNSSVTMVTFLDFDFRSMMDALASVKYYVADYSEDQDAGMLPYGYSWYKDVTEGDNKYSIFINDYALPIGYTFSSVMTESELSAYSAVEKQELMVHNAVVEDDVQTQGTYTKAETETTALEIPVESVAYDNVLAEDGVYRAQKGGTITFRFTGLPNCETYLCFTEGYSGMEENPDNIQLQIRSDNGSYIFTSKSLSSSYSLRNTGFVLNAGYGEDALTEITLRFPNETVLEMQDIKIVCQPMDHYESDMEKLREDVLENVEITGNGVKGTISTDQDKLLAFSIPCQKGWTAYVDGQPAELLNVNIMYMGIEISPGEHTVELVYEIPWMKEGIILTVVSFLLWLILWIRGKRISKRNESHD